MNLGIDQSLSDVNAISGGAVYTATASNGWLKVIDCPAASPNSNIATTTLDTGLVMVCYYDTGNNVTVLTNYDGGWNVIPVGQPLHAPVVGLSGAESNGLTACAIQSIGYVFYLDVLGRMIQLSGSLFWQMQELSSPSNAPQGYPGAGIASAASGVHLSVFYTDMQGNIILITPNGPAPGQPTHENISAAASAPPAALGFGMTAVLVYGVVHLYYMDQSFSLVELRNIGGLWTYTALGKQLNAPAGAYSNLSAFLLNGTEMRVYYTNSANEVIEVVGTELYNYQSFSSWAWSNVAQQVQGFNPVAGQLYAAPGPNNLPQITYRTNADPYPPCGQIAALYWDNPSIGTAPPPPLHWVSATIVSAVR